jgi:transposase
MTFGVKDICDRFSVGEHTVLGWIRTGELRAIDVSRTKGKRPKWRISAEALEQFELTRMTAPPAPRTPRRRKPAGVLEFYK